VAFTYLDSCQKQIILPQTDHLTFLAIFQGEAIDQNLKSPNIIPLSPVTPYIFCFDTLHDAGSKLPISSVVICITTPLMTGKSF